MRGSEGARRVKREGRVAVLGKESRFAVMDVGGGEETAVGWG